MDSIDQPARPLGAKRAALQQRRHGVPAPSLLTNAPCSKSDGSILISQDGSVTYALHVQSNGLWVDRAQRHTVGTRLVQTLVFPDQPMFDRWCSAEPLRFDDALLFAQLVREGHDAFSHP